MVQLEDLDKLGEEEVQKPEEKSTLLTKYNIPLHHLDFDYVKKCQNAKELEQIFRILKSGEEGYFPDLLNATADRLKSLKPNSKYLREVCPVLHKNEIGKDEWNNLSSDLTQWIKDVKKKDKELDERKVKEVACNVDVRKFGEERKIPTKPNEERIKSTDYESWDKYDPDTEIFKMDMQDEKVKKDALEKQDRQKKSKMVRFSNFATEAEALYEANSEKERGNECFKAGEYANALQHYNYSIQCKPLAVTYTNRAIVNIKLKKHQLAIKDCAEALKLDPNSFKAYLRLAQAHETLKNYDEALKNVKRAITLDPNNIVAQELANRLYKLCEKETMTRCTKFTIQDIETNSASSKPETKTQSLKPILKNSAKTAEIIPIPGSSKMPPPYYKVVNSADPEIIKKEKQKILCKPRLLHITTIDASEDEVESVPHNARNNTEDIASANILKEIKKLNEELAIKKASLVAPANAQTQTEKDAGAGGEPHNQEDSKISDVLLENLDSSYAFTSVWNSARKDQTYLQQAAILRKLDSDRIHEVIGYNMDADMLSGIIQCLHKHFMVPGELHRLRTTMINLNKIPRFQMTLLFLSDRDRQCMKKLVQFLDQHDKALPINVRNIYSN